MRPAFEREGEMNIDMVRSITRLLLCIAVGLSLIGASSVAKADDIAYMVTGGGSFGTIDLTTGVYTQLGVIPLILVGLAVEGTTLYGAGAGDNNQFGQLWSVDPVNGSLTAIGQPTGIQYTGFGSLNNTLYAIDNTSANPNLYSIDSSTGAATLIGPLKIAPLAGYWSLSSNSTALYFQLNSTLYTLNTTTGQASPVGQLSGQLQVGAIVEVNGTLYAGQDNTSFASLEILALDKSTGAATVVSKVSGVYASYIYGLAPLLSYSTSFPQVAVGGGWSTSFTLSNTGGATISGNLILTDQNGNPWTVSSTSLGTGSSFPVSISPGGTMFLTVNTVNSNNPGKSGWATVETTGGSPSGVATYQLLSGGSLQTAAGVLPSPQMQFATIPVDDDYSQNRLTAYALANPTDQTIEVKLCTVDQNGNVVNDTVTITLSPGQQIARYLYQDLNNPQFVFTGSMVLRGQAGGTFVAVALIQQNPQLFTVIPVIPSKAPNMPN
jgi:hypothetical protein